MKKMMTSADRLVLFIRNLGKKQKNIADDLKININTVGYYCSGKSKLPVYVAKAMQAEYGLSANWLLHGSGEMMLPADKAVVPIQPLPDMATEVLSTASPFFHELKDIRTRLNNIEARLNTMEERLNKRVDGLENNVWGDLSELDQRLSDLERNLDGDD